MGRAPLAPRRELLAQLWPLAGWTLRRRMRRPSALTASRARSRGRSRRFPSRRPQLIGRLEPPRTRRPAAHRVQPAGDATLDVSRRAIGAAHHLRPERVPEPAAPGACSSMERSRSRCACVRSVARPRIGRRAGSAEDQRIDAGAEGGIRVRPGGAADGVVGIGRRGEAAAGPDRGAAQPQRPTRLDRTSVARRRAAGRRAAQRRRRAARAARQARGARRTQRPGRRAGRGAAARPHAAPGRDHRPQRHGDGARRGAGRRAG